MLITLLRTISSFTHKRQLMLKSKLKGEPKFSLQIYRQKQIAIMTWCIKNQQTEKHLSAFDQKRAKKIQILKAV